MNRNSPRRLARAAAGIITLAIVSTAPALAGTLVSNSVRIYTGVHDPDNTLINAYTTDGSAVSRSFSTDFAANAHLPGVPVDQVTVYIPNTVSTFSASASAASTFGSIKNSVSLSIQDYTAESYSTRTACPYSFCGAGSTFGDTKLSMDPVSSFSQVRDTLVINDAAKNGTKGYFDVSFAVDGTSSLTYSDNLSSNWPSAQGIMTVKKQDTASNNYDFYQSFGFTQSTNVTTNLVEFTYGTPFELTLQSSFFIAPLDAISANPDPNDPFKLSDPTDLWSLDGSVEFGHTILLSNITVFDDAAGSIQASGFTLAAESGVDYAVSPVPLPAAVWFFGSGLLGLLGLSRRRRNG